MGLAARGSRYGVRGLEASAPLPDLWWEEKAGDGLHHQQPMISSIVTTQRSLIKATSDGARRASGLGNPRSCGRVVPGAGPGEPRCSQPPGLGLEHLLLWLFLCGILPNRPATVKCFPVSPGEGALDLQPRWTEVWVTTTYNCIFFFFIVF